MCIYIIYHQSMLGQTKKEKKRKKMKLSTKAEAIIICLDSGLWMENTKSAMFLQQRAAILYYCQHKFKSHPKTIIGLFGSSDHTDFNCLRATNDLEKIKYAIDDIMIGGNIQIVEAAETAHTLMMFDYIEDMQKRLVFFCGGPLYSEVDEAESLGKQFKDHNIACDVISFGDPYMETELFFNTLICLANNDGNCNVCRVPPESSVAHALSRSQIFNPRVGGGSGSEQSSGLPPHDQNKPIVVYVHAPVSDVHDRKTDCPVCQSVLLTLEEKNLPYETEFINLRQKPEWFLQVNPDWTLPLIKFSDGRYVSNSEVILGMIEEMYPNPVLVAQPHLACWGLKILPKIAAYLKLKKDDRNAEDLLYELRRLDAHLENDGPYVNGSKISTVDLSLAPKLYHLEHACKLAFPQDRESLQRYRQRLYDRPSFKKTKPTIEDVEKGWCKRLGITKDKMPR